MQLLEVNNKKTRKLFHKVPHLIYHGDPNWACPLEGMVEDTFNPNKNKAFKNGKAIRWVLIDDEKKLLGRIAAFINFNTAAIFEQATGGTGFFECIDNQNAANKLFTAALEWNEAHGMEAMDGPVNFGENFMNWGLLAEGFLPQGFGMPYNPPYYAKLFQNFGFGIYYKQFSYHLDYSVPFPERFWKIAAWVAQKPQYSFKHLDYGQLDKFVRDFCAVYDGAWRMHAHYKPLDPEDIRDFLLNSKPIVDPEMVWFAYHKDQAIAMFGMIPDINQILRKLNGKLNLWGMLKFLYYKKTKLMTRTRIIIMGIDLEFQRSGIESALFWHQEQMMKKKPQYKEVELSWAGDFNPKIIAVYEATGAKKVKTHYTMRYLFDRNKPFETAPIIT